MLLYHINVSFIYKIGNEVYVCNMQTYVQYDLAIQFLCFKLNLVHYFVRLCFNILVILNKIWKPSTNSKRHVTITVGLIIGQGTKGGDAKASVPKS